MDIFLTTVVRRVSASARSCLPSAKRKEAIAVDRLETGNGIMRLQASDEDVYRIMDVRERYLVGMVVSAMVCGILLAVFIMLIRKWDLLYFAGTAFFGACFLLIRAVRCGWRIMEMKQCYLEITQECFVVRQAEKNGRYESCRIYLDEIEKIIEGSRRGVPEFYVVVCPDAAKSFVLADRTRIRKNIILVKSFGYAKETFHDLYRKLLWEVPGKTRIVGTNTQETWYLKKPQAGFLLCLGTGAVYLLLKAVSFLI